MTVVKVHNCEKGIILAVCDTELLGKKFEENGIFIDVSSEFYKGEEKSDDGIIKLIRNCYTLNLVGKTSVGLGKKAGIVDEDAVIYVSGIPHIQVLLG